MQNRKGKLFKFYLIIGLLNPWYISAELTENVKSF